MLLQRVIEILVGFCLETFLWQEGIICNLMHINTVATFSGEYKYLTHNIYTTQIYFGVWFSIAFLLGLLNDFRKAPFCIVIIENKIQATRQYGLYLMYFITRSDQMF